MWHLYRLCDSLWLVGPSVSMGGDWWAARNLSHRGGVGIVASRRGIAWHLRRLREADRQERQLRLF
jgi:hypothetical protein